MDWFSAIPAFLTVGITAAACRLPFLRFPIDDDFSIYTYIARFRHLGLQWEKDQFMHGKSMWVQLLLDRLFGAPEGGAVRTRLLFMIFHIAGSWAFFGATLHITGNIWAAWAAGMLYAFYGSYPDYTAGNYSQEQFSVPLLFAGLALAMSGQGWLAPAGLLFGLAVLTKITLLLYVALGAALSLYHYGLTGAGLFLTGALAPVLGSLAIDRSMGFWSLESVRQIRTRLAVGVSLVQSKHQYFSMPREALRIIAQTLPVWLFGLPGLFLSAGYGLEVWFFAFAGFTLAMVVAQHGFSRYQYHMPVGVMCLASGLTIHHLLQNPGTLSSLAWGLFAVSLAGSLYYLLPFFLRPGDIRTLARCEKFDQYIYLPHLGRILKRRLRMNGESDRRIFVWGTFSQLYHYSGAAAPDANLHHAMGPWNNPEQERYFDNVIGGLIRHKPVYLIKAFHDLNVEELCRATGLRYRYVKTALMRFPIYRLEGYAPPEQNPLALAWPEKGQLLERITTTAYQADVKKTDCEGKPIPGINKAALKNGAIDASIKECRKLCRLNPYDTRGLYLLSKLYDRKGRIEDAFQTLRQLMEIDPGIPHARMILTKLSIQQRDFGVALRWLESDVQRFGERGESLFYRGQICQGQGGHADAVAYLTEACRLNPDWEYLHYLLATSLEKTGDLDRARIHYEDAFKAVKDSHWDAKHLRFTAAQGAARTSAHRVPESETLRIFFEQQPSLEVLAYAYASALEKEGRAGEAKTLFSRFTHDFKIDQYRASAWFRLARLSPPAERRRMLEECLKIAPEHGGALKMLEVATSEKITA